MLWWNSVPTPAATPTPPWPRRTAIYGAAMPRRHWGKKSVVTGVEHPSVQLPIRALKEEGFTVVEIAPERDGHIDTEKFLAAVDKNTVLAACMAVNNETGARQDAPTSM